MSIRTRILAGVLSVPLVAGAAFAADLADRATALLQAASRNDAQMVDMLLKAHVDVNSVNEYGATALYVAAENAEPAMVQKLLAAGANPNVALQSGETPLMVAARRGKTETVALLLSAHANPNAKESNGGQTALMWAIAGRQSATAAELIKRGADINARSKTGFTPLMFAAQQDDAASARLMLAAGVNANEMMPKSGLTPLIIAAAMNHEKVASELLDKAANPDAVDSNGFTSLHHAARDRDAVGMVKLLLKHHANPNVRLKQQKPTITASGISLQGATPLLLATEINNLDVIVALVEGGADPSIPTERKTSPLAMAVGAGTDISRPRPRDERETSLKTAQFLVARGADVNAAGEFGWTPLHAASYQGLNDVITFLVGKGAKLDVKDVFGQTPLSISYTILTKGLGAAYDQAPRVLRPETSNLLLKLGATPLDKSGVEIVGRRAE